MRDKGKRKVAWRRRNFTAQYGERSVPYLGSADGGLLFFNSERSSLD
jgi:hypothetical protein